MILIRDRAGVKLVFTLDLGGDELRPYAEGKWVTAEVSFAGTPERNKL